MRLLIRLVINAIALWVAVQLLPGLTYDNGVTGLLILALIFGLVNAVIRPIAMFLTCPLRLLTLGVFTWVVNAFMLWLAVVIGNRVGVPFTIDRFWDALLGSIVVSVVSLVLSLLIRESKGD